MFKRFGVLFTLVFVLSGCGKNVCGPLPPPAISTTFEQQIDTLGNPAAVAIWIDANAEYDLNYNFNWFSWEKKGFPDQAYALAYSLYTERHGGKNRGVCGQFAAFYIMAARENGYKCGGICYYGPRSGHAMGWIVEKDGSVSITDNGEYRKSLYRNYEHFEASWTKKMASDVSRYGMLMNEKFEVMTLLP